MKYPSHIFFVKEDNELWLLDQRALPCEEKWISCKNTKDIIYALQTMVVRGAPAIGVVAAFGCYLATFEIWESGWQIPLRDSLNSLEKARPTAVNLAWVVTTMRKIWNEAGDIPILDLQKLWLNFAIQLQQDDILINKAMGKIGSELINKNDCIMTHCNAGELATAGYGTALGVIRAAHEQGKNISVIANETRPFLQGARLTAFELKADNIPVTVACDNACALLMQQNKVQLVIVGADRIVANGDTANKIGTSGIAILAKYYNIPFYVAAPLSTFDNKILTGTKIPIEQRPEQEVTYVGNTRIVPNDVPVFNYAFDITDASLITGIITEKGILKPPYINAIKGIFKE